MFTRAQAVNRIAAEVFDVCVIGAGATGAGCALDAQLRGLKTVVVDANDFASGTSSASSKLIHGGVRYLEQVFTDFDPGQFQVVRCALQERRTVLRNAPHLAHSLRLLVPCYSSRELYYYRIGLKLYDWISGPGMLFASRLFSVSESLTHMPNLSSEGLTGAVAYADGQFDDSRYNLALITTLRAAGGTALNYARVIGFQQNSGGKLEAAQIRDVTNQREFVIRARAFINAAGPASDELRALAKPGLQSRLRLSKGVHIVLPLDVLGGADALLIPKTEDGRVIFAMPWLGRLVVGATDEEVSPDTEMVVNEREVQYLLRHLNRYLSKPASSAEVVSCFAGVRPLLRAERSRQTKKLPRSHEVQLDNDTGMINIRGGKWTTYRLMARDTINVVQQYLGLPLGRCSTAHHLLTGAAGYSQEYAQSLTRYGISSPTASHLGEKFGTCAEEVLALAVAEPALRTLLVEGFPAIRAEVVYAARAEMAISIEDVLARRIGLQFFAWNAAIEAAPVVGDLLARELGWSEEERISATRQYVRKIERLMQMAGIRELDAAPRRVAE